MVVPSNDKAGSDGVCNIRVPFHITVFCFYVYIAPFLV